jgi:hypothetical protein
LRKFGCALFVLVVCAGVSLADEVKGKVKGADDREGREGLPTEATAVPKPPR